MFSLAELTEILGALPDPVFILTRSGRYVAVLGGSDARYYHDGSGLVGQRISDVLVAEKADWFLAEIAKALQAGTLHVVEYGLAGSDVKGLSSDGPQQRIWFEGRVQALAFRVDGEEAVVWVASNITERHELEQRLRAQSETDALTGLWNRRHFEKRAPLEHERAQRHAYPVAILIFDIDHFKSINDSCGHEIGDQVLKQVAQTVKACIRESDLVTRWGGDEFTVLMPYADAGHAATAAEKIRQAIASLAFSGGLKVSVSIGVAEWATPHESIGRALSRADEALYGAKSEGRNRVVLAAPPRDAQDHAMTVRHARLLWRRHFESGHSQIDAQHRSLFECVERVQETAAKLEPGNLASVCAAIDRLIDDLHSHFRYEEEVLGEADWPGLIAHRLEHTRLLSKAARLRAELTQAQSAAAAAELIDFLIVDMVANHILRADRAFHSLFRPASETRQD
ncbi:diguanylate cyclase [Uliginosibacterium sp. TH139]|uniref:diguanylate cyclase n=1 Tax=Uliginosibacterium sp. TH139 TaxID=2067453 RepID=UPI000C7C4009|nr:diguanylate cyclase [Uliginosibacterium sp. TH139]PLK50306.1 hypothetical protein C0V76_00285 [Uliginosibacterium sp. TH139]